MKFDRRNPPKALVIVILAVIAVGVGFLFDFLLTLLEKQIYPQDYATYVEASAEAYGVPEEVVYALIKCESDFDSGAVSRAGAVGLCQLMPDTFLWLTDDILYDHFEVGMLYDPETNIRYGVCYLSRLYDRFGDWSLAFAAYNAGPTRVSEWLEDPAYADGEGGLKKIPFRETRQYVKKMNKVWAKYEKLYGTDDTETAESAETRTASPS